MWTSQNFTYKIQMLFHNEFDLIVRGVTIIRGWWQLDFSHLSIIFMSSRKNIIKVCICFVCRKGTGQTTFCLASFNDFKISFIFLLHHVLLYLASMYIPRIRAKKNPEKSKSAYLGSFQLNPIPMNKHKIKLNPLVEQRWNWYFLKAFISSITTSTFTSEVN